MVERGKSLVIVTPSDRANFLHLLALEALFGPKVPGRNSIFLLSSNTEFREQFRQLAPKSIRPPHDKSRYAREETPIANVTPDGSPAKVTKNLKHPDKPARFFFSYSSTRVPSDEIGQRVRCVLYDDSVKYESERLDRLLRWKKRNDVPSIVYFTSNPTGDIVQRLKNRAFVWTWPPKLLKEAVVQDRQRASAWPTDDQASWTTTRSQLVTKREQNRSNGLSIEVHTCGGGDIVDTLTRANERRAKYEYLARKLDSDVLRQGKTPIRYALGSFRELLMPLDVADFHARRRTVSSRIAGLERFQNRIASDPEASPASGTFRDVVSTLQELEEIWDGQPLEDKKQGVLVNNILYGVLERGESVSVVTATEGHQQALNTYLRSEHQQLYRELGDDLEIHDGHGVRSSEPTDNVILYGALRWKHRDLLRTDVASNAVVLAYPMEMGLLHSQIESVDGAFEEITETGFWKVVDNLTKRATGEEADIEKVNIDLPEFEEPSTSSLGDEITVDEGEDQDLGDIVRGYETDYESDEEFDPSEFETTSSSRTEKRGSTRIEDDCIKVRFEDGSTMTLRPRDEVHTIREGHDKLFRKQATKIKSGDIVVHLEDTEGMRETLYGLIRERGDVGLYYYANMWKVSLEAALKETGDDLDDFVEKMDEQGLDKKRTTYESWYNMEVHRTRSKKSFWAIAEAYDLNGVKEEFNQVWNAVQEMETIYTRLKKALRETALRSAATEVLDDKMLSESPDIRLSDFDIGKYLYRLEVASTTEGVSTKSTQIGKIRGI